MLLNKSAESMVPSTSLLFLLVPTIPGMAQVLKSAVDVMKKSKAKITRTKTEKHSSRDLKCGFFLKVYFLCIVVNYDLYDIQINFYRYKKISATIIIFILKLSTN